MGTRFTESDLQKLGLQKDSDGKYSKKKTVQQPRDIKFSKPTPKSYSGEKVKAILFDEIGCMTELPLFRKITLTLFGEPMPKQSVRATKSGDFFQPKKITDRFKFYQSEIRKQLPKDFKMFETCVFVRKMHFLYAPLKSFHKEKGKMEAIRNGKKFYKNSRPDLPDNLKKLVNDAMSEIVFRDDSIIVAEDDIKKYYSIGGCVIIELEGY